MRAEDHAEIALVPLRSLHEGSFFSTTECILHESSSQRVAELKAVSNYRNDRCAYVLSCSSI